MRTPADRGALCLYAKGVLLIHSHCTREKLGQAVEHYAQTVPEADTIQWQFTLFEECPPLDEIGCKLFRDERVTFVRDRLGLGWKRIESIPLEESNPHVVTVDEHIEETRKRHIDYHAVIDRIAGRAAKKPLDA